MRVVSLFSGAGGLDLGFIKAGHEIVWANDLFHDAVETYRLNIGNHIIEENIEAIQTSSIPACDLIIGGFPCQGFSVANQNRHVEDERNKLYLQYLRILKGIKPKYFVAENVKGIQSLAKGAVFSMIINDFQAAGYKVKFKLVNAADYGVPQKRERIIIFGTRNDLNKEPDFPKQTHSDNKTVKGTKEWVSIGSALSDIPDPDEPHLLKNHTYSKFKLKFNGYLGNRVIDPEKPAPTVTARGDDRGGVVVLHHPSNTRRMSARELASTQSFPIDFEFCGNRSSVYRQIANAVPPGLAYAIAKEFNKL